MQLYPDVQKRAQREIDALTQGRRLPEFSDRTYLPYIDAIVKENNRWHPVTPLGTLSCNSQDCEGRTLDTKEDRGPASDNEG
jgi:cytochrome P450